MQEDIARILNYRTDQCLHASTMIKEIIHAWDSDLRTPGSKYKDVYHWTKFIELKARTMQELLKLLIEVDKDFCDS